MVMSTGLGIGVNGNRARPQLIRTGACMCDGSSPIHARRLWRVGIELVSADNLHAMLAPINFWTAVSHDLLFHGVGFAVKGPAKTFVSPGAKWR